MTLIELIVVLAILSVIAGVTTLAFRTAPPGPRTQPWAIAVAAARRSAIDSARVVTLSVRVGDSLYAATALPDGSVIADPALGIDRLTGEARHEP